MLAPLLFFFFFVITIIIVSLSSLVPATNLFPPKLPRMRLPIVLIYMYPYLKFSVVLHCCQIKSKLGLISNACYIDVGDIFLHIVLQGTSIRLAGFFLAAKEWLTCGLHTSTEDKFPSCCSP